jgi:metal-dependent amidase/aminoacylase/carboxypeptidase family protein
MASLYTALKHAAKNRDQLKRNLIFCFQPGEEGKAGASKLFKAKPDLLEGVHNCYALHFMNAAYPGVIALAKGAVTAMTSSLTIIIEGKSSHCMCPNAGVDANFIGCTLVTQLYSLIGMKIPPLEGATLVVKQVVGGGNVAKVSDRF